MFRKQLFSKFQLVLRNKNPKNIFQFQQYYFTLHQTKITKTHSKLTTQSNSNIDSSGNSINQPTIDTSNTHTILSPTKTEDNTNSSNFELSFTKHELKNEIDILMSKIENYQYEISRLTESLHKLKSDNDNSIPSVATTDQDLITKYFQLHDKYTKLEESVSSLKQSRTLLQNEVKDTQPKIQLYKKEIEKLQKVVKQKTEENDALYKLKLDNMKLESTLEELRPKCEELEEENEKLKDGRDIFREKSVFLNLFLGMCVFGSFLSKFVEWENSQIVV